VQQSNEAKSSCEERAQQVFKSLTPDNALRHALEQGQRGDCVRKSWMDKMQQFGIKQALFLIEYSWKKEKVSFKIKNTSYLREYYFNYDSGRIKDGKLLREIKESGLEQELRDAILARVKSSVFAKREKDQVSRDVFEANLLDDEALPVLDIIF
jgi:hypothetical protein